MNEPYVNHALMDRVLEIKQRSENSKHILEVVGITDLWTKAIHMTQEELITWSLACLAMYPESVFQALALDREELLRNQKRKGINRLWKN